MKKGFFIGALVWLATMPLHSQSASSDFRHWLEVTNDTISPEDYLEVTYHLENVQLTGMFPKVEIEGMQLVQGPSTTSNMSIMNGKTTISASFTYTFQPLKPGKFKIEELTVNTDQGKRIFEDKKIYVKEGYILRKPKKQQPQDMFQTDAWGFPRDMWGGFPSFPNMPQPARPQLKPKPNTNKSPKKQYEGPVDRL